MCRFKLPKGRRGIRACAISDDGKRSVVVDISNDHCVTCFDNASGNKVWEQKGGPDTIVDVAFQKGTYDVAAAGVKKVQFFAGDDGNNRGGIIGDHDRTNFGSIRGMGESNANGCWVAAGANGQLYWWDSQRKVCKVQTVCAKKPIISLQVCSKKIMCGSSNGDLYAMEHDGSNCETMCSHHDSVRAICMKEGKCALGLGDSTICIGVNPAAMKPCMKMHGDGEAWGLGHDGS